jgi:carbon monoxide dehydrogenase subunit G
MQLEHEFGVQADPDDTYGFLLDVNRIASCIPGISGVESTGPETFVGLLKVKVGPVGVTYRGTATITARDPSARTATIRADGTEGVGAGGVHAVAVMTVEPAPGGSLIRISTDVAIAGRLAQFGRGIIDGVAKRILGQMADCIRNRLEGETNTSDAVAT